MRFVLEVDLDAGALAGNRRGEELGRILRYWGGSMQQVQLAPGARQELYDSDYTAVGTWRVDEGSAAPLPGMGRVPGAEEVAMTEVPGTDRRQAEQNVLHETPLVPESVEDAGDDDPRSTDTPTNRGDDGETGESAKPPAGSTDLDI